MIGVKNIVCLRDEGGLVDMREVVLVCGCVTTLAYNLIIKKKLLTNYIILLEKLRG